MSVGLDVKLSALPRVGTLLEHAEGVARRILCLEAVPSMRAHQLFYGTTLHIASTAEISPDMSILVNFETSHDEYVSVTVIDVPVTQGYEPDEETGLWLSVGVVTRVPRCFALAASLAIAAAQISNSYLVDESHVWTLTRIVGPDELLDKIRLGWKRHDMEAAVLDFYKALPRANHS